MICMTENERIHEFKNENTIVIAVGNAVWTICPVSSVLFFVVGGVAAEAVSARIVDYDYTGNSWVVNVRQYGKDLYSISVERCRGCQ